MGVITRLRRILRANVNDALERAEDPAKMLNYLVLEMQEGVEQTREEVASAMAAERRLAQQAAQAYDAAAQWDQRARRAIEHGEEELAREALRRKVTAQELAAYYQNAHVQQQQAVHQLRATLERLEMRMAEAKAKRNMLMAQLDTARAQQMVARSLQQAVGIEAFETFDRIEGKITNTQYRASAIAELTQQSVDDALLIAEEHQAIEHELSNMKRELGYVEVERQALEHQREAQGE